MMLHLKFDQDWPTGFKDIQVQMCEIFCHSRACNSKMSGLIRPKIEQPSFYACPGYQQLDDDLIKNERASMDTIFPL